MPRVNCKPMQYAAVCASPSATWVGEDEHGDREYMLDWLDWDNQRCGVHSDDLLEAVCELALRLGCDLTDVYWPSRCCRPGVIS